MPTHHTRSVGEREGRSGAYLETAFHVPDVHPLPDPLPAIMDLCAENDIVFDCGHVSGVEAVRMFEEAQRRGVRGLRTHCSRYEPDEIKAITNAGGYAEFGFFLLTHATQVGLTHVDEEKHSVPGQTIQDLAPRIRAAGDRAIVSTDCGVYLLPPPVEGFREYMLMLESEGFDEAAIRRMNTTNPAALFGIS
jgi:hypothetical protein